MAEQIIAISYDVKFGVGIANQRDAGWTRNSLNILRPQVWYDWLAQHLDDPTYFPMVYTPQVGDTLNIHKATAFTHRYKDRIWLLGNEPEMTGSLVSVANAKAAVDEWIDNFENHTPPWTTSNDENRGTKWAGFGIILPNAAGDFGGMTWLNNYLAAGGAIPDYWHVHNYFNKNVQQWIDSWNGWVSWMEANDVVRPTIISETAMFPYYDGIASEEVVLERHRVQTKLLMNEIVERLQTDDNLYAVFWYSDNDWHNVWPFSDLLDNTGRETTEIGRYFISLMPAYNNLTNDIKTETLSIINGDFYMYSNDGNHSLTHADGLQMHSNKDQLVELGGIGQVPESATVIPGTIFINNVVEGQNTNLNIYVTDTPPVYIDDPEYEPEDEDDPIPQILEEYGIQQGGISVTSAYSTDVSDTELHLVAQTYRPSQGEAADAKVILQASNYGSTTTMYDDDDDPMTPDVPLIELYHHETRLELSAIEGISIVGQVTSGATLGSQVAKLLIKINGTQYEIPLHYTEE